MSGSIKPSLLSQDSNGRVASYNTFNSREDSNPRLSSEYGDTTDEGASLVAASDPYVEDWAASTQQKATVLDLLRFPRLPLALGATVTMAVTVTALETVSVFWGCLFARLIRVPDPPTIRDKNLPLVHQRRGSNLHRSIRPKLCRRIHWQDRQPLWRTHPRSNRFQHSVRSLDLNVPD